MDLKVILVILLTLLLSAVTVTSFAAPSDVAINKIPSNNPAIDKLLLIEGNTASMSANLDNGRLIIKDNLHTQRQVRLNYLEMYKSLKGFNGQTLGYTHIDDNGIITHKVINVGDIDNKGFISLEMTFSTVIIDGFTGYTTQTYSSLSENQSISVPNGTSYVLNITNNQVGAWTVESDIGGNTSEFDYKVPITLNHSGVLSDYQTKLNISMNDSVRFNYANGTYISYWNESADTVWIKNDHLDGDTTIYMYYGNDGLSSESSIYNTMVFGDDFNAAMDWTKWRSTNQAKYTTNAGLLEMQDIDPTSSQLLQTYNTYNDYIATIKAKRTIGSTFGYALGDTATIASFTGEFSFLGQGAGLGLVTMGDESTTVGALSDDTYYRITRKIPASGNGYGDIQEMDGTVLVSRTGTPTSRTNYIGMFEWQSGQLRYVDYMFIRKFAVTEPTYTIGAEQQASDGATNITASITGDSNEQNYNTSQSRQFTLTPTDTTNNVNINTTSTDYDVTVISYWTEDTIKYSESLDDGYANTIIQYTPLNNITSGILNSTYSLIDFSTHDYVGPMITLVDGVNYDSNATRDGQNVNVSIVNFDTSTHWINFTVPYNPQIDLYAPINNGILNFTFPPLNHDVFLAWMNTTGIYKYEVYEGAVIKRTGTVFTNSTAVSLPAGDYTWLAYGYDDVFNEYSQDSASFDFTISTNITYTNTTGVHGVVYDYLIGVETPLENAAVYIWNDTFSDSTITGSNGYFTFTNLVNGTYYLIVKKDRYYDSNTEVVTLTTNNMTEHNIRLIENTGTDYNKHYVKFILKSFFGTLYSDVLTNVYIGDSTTVFQTDMTGHDGSVTFELTQSQEYRFTFVSVAQNIDITKVITPSDTLYNIIVFGASIIPEPPAQDDILYSVQGININTTQGFINVSFNDTSGTTTFAEALIKDKNTLTTLYQFNTTDSTDDWSQIVDAGNASYVVVFNIDNTILEDTLTITKTIYFDNEVNINLGLENNWSYILIAVIIITTVALLSSRLNAEIMAVITVLTGWSMIFFGWLTAGLPLSGKITIWMMMLLATLIAFATVIKKGDR